SVRPFRSSEAYVEAMKEDLAEWLNALYGLGLPSGGDGFLTGLATGTTLAGEDAATAAAAAAEIATAAGAPARGPRMTPSDLRNLDELGPDSRVVPATSGGLSSYLQDSLPHGKSAYVEHQVLRSHVMVRVGGGRGGKLLGPSPARRARSQSREEQAVLLVRRDRDGQHSWMPRGRSSPQTPRAHSPAGPRPPRVAAGGTPTGPAPDLVRAPDPPAPDSAYCSSSSSSSSLSVLGGKCGQPADSGRMPNGLPGPRGPALSSSSDEGNPCPGVGGPPDAPGSPMAGPEPLRTWARGRMDTQPDRKPSRIPTPRGPRRPSGPTETRAWHALHSVSPRAEPDSWM
ncbi:hypothetical protein E2I00_017755, partial [Balaenoptera physalus]